MAKVTLEQIITVLIGIPGTDEGGIAGDVKELVKGQAKQNIAIAKNTMGRRIIYGAGGVLFSGGGIALILKLVGIY